VAKKSSSIVERIIGELKTKRSPSAAARRLISLLPGSAAPRTPRINSRPVRTARNESALTR
jgi:hypothetical protein